MGERFGRFEVFGLGAIALAGIIVGLAHSLNSGGTPATASVGETFTAKWGDTDCNGTVGVLGGLEAIRALQQSGFQPQRSIELLLFTSEEPTRFGLGCLGSRMPGSGLDSDADPGRRAAEVTTPRPSAPAAVRRETDGGGLRPTGRDEVGRHRRENRVLAQERGNLKKAAAFFARESAVTR